MNEAKIKCFKKEHKDINAISYCEDCKINICNNCLFHHHELFCDHKIKNLNNDKDISFDICKEKNHTKLDFYCKNHNKLCCAACITNIEANGYRQHKDCDVISIQDIKEEKRNQLKENMKYLEDLSNNLNTSIDELKSLLDNSEEKKEELKLSIQNIFNQLKIALNEREEKLLLEVENQYKEIFDNEDILEESEKLSNKIKLLLEEGKIFDEDWNDSDKLNSILNSCINIENNIKSIKLTNETIKNRKINKDLKIEFKIEKENFDDFMEDIKSFGTIYKLYKNNNNKEEERKCIIINPKYIIDIPKEIKGNKSLISIYLTLKKNYLDKKQILHMSTSNPLLYKSFGSNLKFLLEEKRKDAAEKAEKIESFFKDYDNSNIYSTKEFSLSKKAMCSLSMFKEKEKEDVLKIQELPNEVGLMSKCMLYLLDEKFDENQNNKQIFEILLNILEKNGEKNFKTLFDNYFQKNKFLKLTQEKAENINKIIKQNDHNILNMIKMAKISRPMSLFCFLFKEVYDYINLKTEDGHYYYDIRIKKAQLKKYLDFINLYDNDGKVRNLVEEEQGENQEEKPKEIN